MKKLFILSLVLAAGLVTSARAQHFVASFGIQHSWGVPDFVTHTVYDRFYNYDWVHAHRVHHGGGIFSFNVLLQRGNSFLEVNFNRFGNYQVVNHYNYYPLGGHVCDGFCGYHPYYYDSYFATCHSHNHWGHNHIIYRPRPVNYVFGFYRNYPVYHQNTTVIYNNYGQSHQYVPQRPPAQQTEYVYTDGNPHRVRFEDRYQTRRVSESPSSYRKADMNRTYRQSGQADRSSARQQVERSSARQQMERSNARQQVQRSSARQQAERSNARQQVQRSNARQQVQRSSARQQAERSNARQQVQRSNARQQVQRSSSREEVKRSTRERSSSGTSRSGQSRGRGRGN